MREYNIQRNNGQKFWFQFTSNVDVVWQPNENKQTNTVKLESKQLLPKNEGSSFTYDI